MTSLYRAVRSSLVLIVVACQSEKAVDTGSAHADADGDRYDVTEDCDDADPAVNPGESELPYDGIDNDCDPETVDDDLDGDGALAEVDCDDGNAEIHPGAAEICDGLDDDCDGDGDEEPVDSEIEEECGNRVDDNCDGLANDCQLAGEYSVDDAQARFLGLRALGYEEGDWASVVGEPADLVGDASPEVVVAVGADEIFTGLTYIFPGPVAGELAAEDAVTTISGTGDGEIAQAAVIADLDEDTGADLALARWGTAPGAPLVDLFSGPVAEGSLTLADAEAHLLADLSYGLSASYQGMFAADMDGDEVEDLVVAAQYASSFCDTTGQVAVGLGPVGEGDHDLDDADVLIMDYEACYLLISSPGDLDGDGARDLVVSDSYAAAYRGALYVMMGPVTSGIVQDADQVLTGEGYYLGGALAGADDADGDGLPDLWASSSGLDGTAAAGLYAGSSDGLTTEIAATVLLEDEAYVGAISTGDLNGDDAPDVIVGEFILAPPTPGAIHLVYGPFEGTVTTADADAHFIGSQPGDLLGGAGTYVADFDGDGLDDVICSAFAYDDWAGGAYLFTSLGL